MKRFALILFVAFVFSCLGHPSYGYGDLANLWITKDFSSKLILDKEFTADGKRSVMKVLRENAKIETTYGGGFVNSINGYKNNRSGYNWFYFINGIMPNKGAAAYKPDFEDTVWWDYHHRDVMVSAVIGSYPEPFKSGMGEDKPGTKIVFTDNFTEKSLLLRDSLFKKGVDNIYTKSFTGKLKADNEFVLLIGLWNELNVDEDINELSGNKRKGFYADFKSEKVNVRGSDFKVAKTFENGAVIISVRSGFSTDWPVWVITGNNKKDINAALDILINEPSKIRYFCGALIAGSRLFALPYQK